MRRSSTIGKVGYDPLFGARPLKRAIQQEIENPVAKLILAGKFGPKDVIPVEVERRQACVRPRRALKREGGWQVERQWRNPLPFFYLRLHG